MFKIKIHKNKSYILSALKVVLEYRISIVKWCLTNENYLNNLFMSFHDKKLANMFMPVKIWYYNCKFGYRLPQK